VAKYTFWILLAWSIGVPGRALAAPPCDTLLPSTTQGYLSIPDVDTLRERWSATQLGHLVKDPVMKPFIEDLEEQIRSKMSQTRVRLGITLEDLKGIYGGELCLAVLQPNDKQQPFALALLVDVTGHLDEVQAMLSKVSKNLLEQGATKRNVKIAKAEATVFTLPKQREENPVVEATYVVHRDMLVVTDSHMVCEQIIAQLDGSDEPSFQEDAAYAATKKRVTRDIGAAEPQVSWFVNPFGYARVLRDSAGGRKKRGADLLKILPRQGFDAIKGVGGVVFLATPDEEILHQTYVFAPPVQRDKTDGEADKKSEKYDLAARMLEFPNSDKLQPQPWVSRDLGTYLSFNWKIREAFEHSKSLVNDLMGAEDGADLFEDIITSLAKDKDGPQVDLRHDLIAHFGERVSRVTDCRRPVTPDSERLLFAIELNDPVAVANTIDKAFDADPDAERREFDGQTIWEIIADDDPVDIEEIQIEGEGFNPLGLPDEDEPVEESGDSDKIMPNSAVAVVHGHLIVASHVDAIVDMLKRPLGAEVLSATADFAIVNDALAKLGSHSDSFRLFARTDEAYRPTYELIRQGKMPEAKTVLGKLLNRVLGPDEEGILREQQIDGSKMPDFDVVRRYLGPSGLYVRSEEAGWYVAGCLLSKEAR